MGLDGKPRVLEEHIKQVLLDSETKPKKTSKEPDFEAMDKYHAQIAKKQQASAAARLHQMQ